MYTVLFIVVFDLSPQICDGLEIRHWSLFVTLRHVLIWSFLSVHCQLQSLDQQNIAQQLFFCFEPIKKHELELETSQATGNIDLNQMSTVGERMVSDKNQSVFCRAPTLFTKSAYVCNKEFYWPICVEIGSPNATVFSQWVLVTVFSLVIIFLFHFKGSDKDFRLSVRISNIIQFKMWSNLTTTLWSEDLIYIYEYIFINVSLYKFNSHQGENSPPEPLKGTQSKYNLFTK